MKAKGGIRPDPSSPSGKIRPTKPTIPTTVYAYGSGAYGSGAYGG